MKSFVLNRTLQRKLQTLKRKEVNGGKERGITEIYSNKQVFTLNIKVEGK